MWKTSNRDLRRSGLLGALHPMCAHAPALRTEEMCSNLHPRRGPCTYIFNRIPFIGIGTFDKVILHVGLHIYIYMHGDIHIHIYIPTHTFTCIHMCIYTYMRACMHAYIHARMDPSGFVCGAAAQTSHPKRVIAPETWFSMGA